MRNLNDTNGASTKLLEIAQKVFEEFDGKIIGVEMGIAWAGGVESIGKMWGDKGIIYGMDTFEGHPKHLAPSDSFEGKCMDGWYQSWGYDELKIEFIQNELDKQGLSNVKLVKGIIDGNTKLDVPYFNYVLIDLDIPQCMEDGYKLVKNKIVKGGYLCLHDVVPDGHIGGLNNWYKRILNEDGYDLVAEYPESYLAILKKK